MRVSRVRLKMFKTPRLAYRINRYPYPHIQRLQQAQGGNFHRGER